ncbi:MAG TPA: hypothetical protein VNF05_01555 [Acidimicrobiales bacterium]|nr:hypothetical protein [Acidimicrobiales bacterium]
MTRRRRSASTARSSATCVQWVHYRIGTLRALPDYAPLLHFDGDGTIGEVFDGDPVAIADYLFELAPVAVLFQRRVEHPLDAGGREAQIVAMAQLRRELKTRSINVQTVADEWCHTLRDIEAFVAGESADVIHVKMPDLGGANNTIEPPPYVRVHGLRAYCGGSRTETDVSARVGATVARARATAPIRSWPSRAWAWTKGSRSSATRWRGSRHSWRFELASVDVHVSSGATRRE